MQFTKINEKPERYVNVEQIETITFPAERADCDLQLRSGRIIRITRDAGRTLLEFAETNTYLTEPPVGYLPSLKTRIAQLLRDTEIHGLEVIDIRQAFAQHDNADIEFALGELMSEGIIKTEPQNRPGAGVLFKHAMHAHTVAAECDPPQAGNA